MTVRGSTARMPASSMAPMLTVTGIVAGIVLIALLLWLAAPSHRRAPAPSGVVVVSARPTASPPIVPGATGRPPAADAVQRRSLDPQAVEAEVLRVFPVLASARFACTQSRCELKATPRSRADDAALQTLYQGALTGFFAAYGLKPTGPVRTDEIGADETRIVLTMQRDGSG